MKNLFTLTVILSIVFAFNHNTFGQQQFGIKISGGLSKITNSMELSDVTHTTLFVPSGQAGFYYNRALGKKSSLGAELLFSQLEGKEILEGNSWSFDEFGNKVYFGYRKNNLYRHISYLSLPFYYGFKINRLLINAGFQISYSISSSGREKDLAVIEGEYFKTDIKSKDLYIKRFDMGPKAGIIYQLTNKLAVEGTYYYGLNNIQKGKPVFWISKVQQMTFGIRYALWNKETAQ